MVICWIGFGVGSRAEASGIALSTPAGLSPGDHFRFVFVTDGITPGTSSNIADYNSFVNTQAGGATYNGQVITWDAIASTSTVNAIDNVGQTPDPVYLANGTLVTTSTTTSGLWSGTLLSPISEDLTGSAPGTNNVWTGTGPNGDAATGALSAVVLSARPRVSTTPRPAAGWTQRRGPPRTIGRCLGSPLISSSRDLPFPSHHLCGWRESR
jgi:hypothetical protein